MSFHPRSLFVIGMFLLILPSGWATDPDRFKKNRSEPELHTVVPLGGTVGSTLEVEVRGKFLKGTYAAWMSHDSFKARVLSVEAQDPPDSEGGESAKPAEEGEYRVKLQVRIASGAVPGPHPFRLVAPGGVSNRLYLQIHDDPVIAESAEPHQKPSRAQAVGIPVVVNGIIGRQGELDYYSLDVSTGQEVAFEVVFSHETLTAGFRPQLRLYQSYDSWLGARPLTQLAFHSEIHGEVNLSPGTAGPPIGTTPINSGLTHRFASAGRYLVEVAAERFQGKSVYAYQLRIVPAGAKAYHDRLKDSAWGRTFTREIGADRLQALWARTVTVNRPTDGAAEGQPGAGRPDPETTYDNQEGKRPPPIPATVVNRAEREPNDDPGRAMEVTLPALIEGAIDRPGDVDYFRFKLQSEQRLAFEIETPGLSPPHFSPRLEIKDAAGRSMFTNLHRVKSTLTAGHWAFKDIEPKVIETFDQEGEYTILVSDVTSRSGSRQCRYRLLVRPQIPHVGEMTLETLKRSTEDRRIDPYRINLVQGEAKTVNITTLIEEIDARITDSLGERAFDWGTGEISFLVEDLPQGVRALPGTSILDIKGKPRQETLSKSHYLPDVLKAVLVFQAEPDAPSTILPAAVRILAQPLIGGKPGRPLLVAEVPVMVTGGPALRASSGDAAGR